MLQIRNTTPFSADFALLPNVRGVDSVFPVLKATFDIDDRYHVAGDQPPLFKHDVYRGEPMYSGIAALGDYHLCKPGTDVLVVGDCFLADGSEIICCDVNVEVAHLKKQLCVFGNRTWDGGKITSPEPFERMPLIYERAYGGGDRGAEYDQLYEQNPIGTGYSADTRASRLDGVYLPNIEDPSALIRSLSCNPAPAGVEAVPPFWSQRRMLAGSYDEHWQQQRAPFLPEDFSSKFLQCASSGLISDTHLIGGEPVTIRNMHVDSVWDFTLPSVDIDCRIKWQNRIHSIPLRIDTISLAPNQSQVTYIWRGEFAVNQWVSRVEYLEYSLNGLR